MPVVISFVSPKGGAGKTTASVLLATTIANLGRSVGLIDADPNQPIAKWASKPKKPENVEVIVDVTESDIEDRIEELKAKHPFVIIDLEGTASSTNIYAMSQSDLVIIPLQPSPLDADQATKAMKMVKRSEKIMGRSLPYRILLTRTSSAIKSRYQKEIEKQLSDANAPIMETQLFERSAFKALFNFGGTLWDLKESEVANPKAAQKNMVAVAEEIVGFLKQQQAEE